MNVIIHGPMACGKTRNADKFAAYFGCKTIIEMDDFHWSYQFGKTVDTLFLTNREPTVAAELHKVGGAVVIDFDYAMTLIEQPVQIPEFLRRRCGSFGGVE